MRILFIVADTREQITEILDKVLENPDQCPLEFIYCFYPQAQWHDISSMYSAYNREGFSISVQERILLGNKDNDTESLDAILKLIDYSMNAGLLVSDKVEYNKRRHIYDRYAYQREGISSVDSVDSLLALFSWLSKLSK